MKRLIFFFIVILTLGISISGKEKTVTELPEVVVMSKKHKVLHILAYVREYSSLTTYTDTIFLFREKMVDYMQPTTKSKFKGWLKPRVLTSRSYFHFKDYYGLDSVSDVSNHHFSWSDWIGILPSLTLPGKIATVKSGTDTIFGKYSPTEIWQRDNDSLTLEINVLADITRRKWVPNLSNFFKNDLNFEKFLLYYSFDNVIGSSISPQELTGYSFNIESEGRGHSMFRFNRLDEPFFVSTSAEVYILDKEFITTKEAKKWEHYKFDVDEIGIFEPVDAPDLSPSILALINRVDYLDKDDVKLDFIPDQRMKSNKIGGRNFKIGRRALLMLKQATGISKYKARKNLNKQWNDFRKDAMQRNEEK